jgi:DNA-directed RNA polymerase subunit alpha
MYNHIIKPSEPKLVEQHSEYRAVYVIEPLNPGYGVTIANSLRRVMLSSLQGTAVAYFKIDGLDHEYSTIPGVLEDVVDITLNLKQIYFRFLDDNMQEARVFLKVSGKKAVVAGDIKTSSEIQVLNPEAPVMTLTDAKTSINMEIVIQKGVGFVKAVDQEIPGEIGMIKVDCIFTPVIRVSYNVEDTRVGDKTNYNKVYFDVTTDGSITPLEAIIKSADILIEQFRAVSGNTMAIESPEKGEEVEKEADKGVSSRDDGFESEMSSISLDQLNLSQKLVKALQSGGVNNLAELLKNTKDDLAEMKGVTEKGLDQLEKKLLEFGITL